MGENGLEIIFGKTVTKTFFEKTTKNTRKTMNKTSENLDFHYVLLVFDGFCYVFGCFPNFFSLVTLTSLENAADADVCHSLLCAVGSTARHQASSTKTLPSSCILRMPKTRV